MSERDSYREMNNINRNQVIRHLTASFNSATNHMERAARTKNGPNQTYKLQVEFAYHINEIAVGPKYCLPANIAKCNEFIDSIGTLTN